MRTQRQKSFRVLFFYLYTLNAGGESMNNKVKYGISLALLACTLAGGETAFAGQVYELNPVIVTAQRSKAADLRKR